MEEEIQKAEASVKKAWPVVMSWVGGISALIGLFASLAGGVSWFRNHQRQKAELQGKMALAQGQIKQGEYQAAIQTYGEILKADSGYRPALDEQLNTAMLWSEDFHVPGQNSAEIAAARIDQIMAILDAGLTRSKGTQAADVHAHIGWAHLLNENIAQREDGPLAAQNFRAALTEDPTNVYAHAMMGYWMLHNGGNFAEAVQHFNTAVATGKARPLVRKLQFSSLGHRDIKDARVELMRVANEMRKNGESLDDGYKSAARDSCFGFHAADHDGMTESLSAVPGDEAWPTYLWLDDRGLDERRDEQQRNLEHDFIKANLLELSGKRREALEQYRILQKRLKNTLFIMKDAVDAAIVRLSRVG